MEKWTRDDYVRLGEAIAERRRGIGLARTRLAQLAGVDPSTLFDLEKARRTTFSENTLDSVFNALRWPPWTWRDILDGRDPIDIAEPLSEAQPLTDVQPVERLEVGERRLVTAVQILETAYEALLRGESQSATGLILSAMHMIGAAADVLDLDNDDLARARNAVAHSYQAPTVRRRTQNEAAVRLDDEVDMLLRGPLAGRSLGFDEVRTAIALWRAYEAARRNRNLSEATAFGALGAELVGADVFTDVGRALNGHYRRDNNPPAFDPTIHEPIAAHAPGEPTDAELREQHEAEEEAAQAAEERRRQDDEDPA